MNAAHRARVKAIVDEVLSASPGARAEIIAAACGSDDALARDVWAMISQGGQNPSPFGFADTEGDGAGEDGPGVMLEHRLERYRIVRELGRGGMGVVYLAEDRELYRPVALKVLHPRHAQTATARDRFVREARAMAKLRHPNVVIVHEVVHTEQESVIVMEYVDGTSLSAWLGMKPKWPEVLARFDAAGRGLAAAHAVGLIHRDFKPDNVLVGRDDRVRVTDFGLVRPIEAEEEPLSARAVDETASASLTQTGELLGTPAYMSPEQFDARPIDVRSDQFSFCVALYEGLYGQRPFSGETWLELSQAVQTELPPPPPRDSPVPKWIYDVVRRGLEQDPDRRHASMDALLEALTPPRPPHRARGRWAILAAALGIVAGGLVFRWVPKEPRPGCQAEMQDLVWGDDARVRVKQAFARSGGEDLGRRYEAVDDLLQAGQRSWSEAHNAVCHGGVESDAPAQFEHLGCLLDYRQRLAELVFSLERVDTWTAGSALHWVRRLPSPTGCASHSRNGLAIPMPAEANSAMEVREVRHRLARFRAEIDGGRWTDLSDRTDALAAMAADISFPPVRAEVWATVGWAHLVMQQVPKALEAFEKAEVLAENSGHVALRSRAIVRQAQAHFAADPISVEALRVTLERARSALKRYRWEPALEAELHRLQASLIRFEGGRPEALATELDAALALCEAAKAPECVADMYILRADIALSRPEASDPGSAVDRLMAYLSSRWSELTAPWVCRNIPVLVRLVGATGDFERVRSVQTAPYRTCPMPLLDPAPKRTLRGRVIDAQGAPVHGAEVFASRKLLGGPHRMALFSFPILRTETDRHGAFTLLDVPTSWLLAAEHGAQWAAPIVLSNTAEEPIRLRLEPTAELSIRVQRGRGEIEQIRGTNLFVHALTPELINRVGLNFSMSRMQHDAWVSAGRYDVFLREWVERDLQWSEFRAYVVRDVLVSSGLRMDLPLEVPPAGAGTVTVDVKNRFMGDLGPVHIILLPGTPTISRMTDFERLRPRELRVGLPVAGTPRHRFIGLSAGPYTVCVIPLPTNPALAAVAYVTVRYPETLSLYCRPVHLDEAHRDVVLEIEVEPLRRGMKLGVE